MKYYMAVVYMRRMKKAGYFDTPEEAEKKRKKETQQFGSYGDFMKVFG